MPLCGTAKPNPSFAVPVVPNNIVLRDHDEKRHRHFQKFHWPKNTQLFVASGLMFSKSARPWCKIPPLILFSTFMLKIKFFTLQKQLGLCCCVLLPRATISFCANFLNVDLMPYATSEMVVYFFIMVLTFVVRSSLWPAKPVMWFCYTSHSPTHFQTLLHARGIIASRCWEKTFCWVRSNTPVLDNVRIVKSLGPPASWCWLVNFWVILVRWSILNVFLNICASCAVLGHIQRVVLYCYF